MYFVSCILYFVFISEGKLFKEHLAGVAGTVSERSEEQQRRELNKIFLAGENYCVYLKRFTRAIETCCRAAILLFLSSCFLPFFQFFHCIRQPISGARLCRGIYRPP